MALLALRTICAACAAALLATAPAAADPGTTGGRPAPEPPVLSPAGGLDGPPQAPVAQAGQAAEKQPTGDEPTTTTPTATVPTPGQVGSEVTETPEGQPQAQPNAREAAEPSSGGGGSFLPHTGFAIAGLIAVGTGFLLTGYALRYSRSLDG